MKNKLILMGSIAMLFSVLATETQCDAQQAIRSDGSSFTSAGNVDEHNSEVTAKMQEKEKVDQAELGDMIDSMVENEQNSDLMGIAAMHAGSFYEGDASSEYDNPSLLDQCLVVNSSVATAPTE